MAVVIALVLRREFFECRANIAVAEAIFSATNESVDNTAKIGFTHAEVMICGSLRRFPPP